MSHKKLYRSREEKMLAGVAGGLGHYFDVDPTLIRLGFVVLTFASLLGFLIYVFAAIIVPLEPENSHFKESSEIK